jgi:hypothetical protein
VARGAARKLWKSYFPSVDAVVYLIDAHDRGRFPEAKKELDVRALRCVPSPVAAPPRCVGGVGCGASASCRRPFASSTVLLFLVVFLFEASVPRAVLFFEALHRCVASCTIFWLRWGTCVLATLATATPAPRRDLL